MSNWFPIFLLPVVTLGVPMLAMLFDLSSMARDTSAFAQSQASAKSKMEHVGIVAHGTWSDRDTMRKFLGRP